MSKIDVISSCNVRIATTIINNGNENVNFMNKEMELTPWDLLYLQMYPIQTGILFRKPEKETQEFEKTFIDHLKTSLSRTLDFFHPLAGRIGTIKNEDNTTCFFVDCNNEGAEFIHAIARRVSVSEVLDPTYIPEIVGSFFPQTGISNLEGTSKPLLAVQVTELVDGFFIACSVNHVLADGTSFWHFFNSWSEISRGFDTISKPPVLERWFPENINHSVHIRLLGEQVNLFKKHVSLSPELLERVFHFSKENIAKLKSKANSEMGTDKISSFQSLLAHLWRSIIRGRQKSANNSNNNPNNTEIYLILPVGTRAKIPLPDSYFGNAVYPTAIITNENDLLNHGLGWAALKINELVVQQTREEAIKFVEDWAKKPMGVPRRNLNDICVVSNSPRFNVYGNDFGWGKPIAVRNAKGFKVGGRVTVFPAVEPGGMDVQVCLTQQTMEAMGNDAEFMEVVTSF